MSAQGYNAEDELQYAVAAMLEGCRALETGLAHASRLFQQLASGELQATSAEFQAEAQTFAAGIEALAATRGTLEALLDLARLVAMPAPVVKH